MFNLKLAASNVRRNFKDFAPFLLAAATMFVILFTMTAIATSPSIYRLHGAATVIAFLILGLIVMIVFAVWILIYSYRFLHLQRSRTFGLYHILGFGKKAIMQVAGFELIISYLMTLVLGIGLGILFSKALYLILVGLVGGNSFNLTISGQSVFIVGLIYALLFLILFIISSLTIWRFSSLELFHEASKGEKEPKSNILLAVLSLILLGIGYYIALTVHGVNLFLYFAAVVIVIFGTYGFYISSTIWYLKQRKKRSSYYQVNHFINVSSMLYRMRANAVGLGSITLLLSMALVTMIVSIGVLLGDSARLTSLGREQVGGFVFIGGIIGFSFILGAALIVYYKQLSEAAQDKQTFVTLQKVGLAKAEVHQVIRSQVRILFFLPLGITIFHLFGAYRMLTNLLNAFGITNQQFILIISLFVFSAMAVGYYFIYKLTSRSYYEIVKNSAS